MSIRYLLVLIFLPLFAPSAPRPEPAVRLAAHWITHPATRGSDQAVVLFRRDFRLDDMPEFFEVDVSADNHFRLYLNGEWVAFGPQLGDVPHYRYDREDLIRAGDRFPVEWP